VLALVAHQTLQDLADATAAWTEPSGFRLSSFYAHQRFNCGRDDCPWRYSNGPDLLVVQQRNPRAALLAPGGIEEGGETTTARLSMVCVKDLSLVEVYVSFDLPAPRVIQDGATVTWMADRNRRPAEDILTLRRGSHQAYSTHHLRAHIGGEKAGQFQVLFSDDSIIRDWLNAWSLWVMVPMDNGGTAGAIFDLLHSTRHTDDTLATCAD